MLNLLRGLCQKIFGSGCCKTVKCCGSASCTKDKCAENETGNKED